MTGFLLSRRDVDVATGEGGASTYHLDTGKEVEMQSSMALQVVSGC